MSDEAQTDDEFEIDAPAGWVHESGYRLHTEGAAIEYQADGQYRAICEVSYDEERDDFEYVTVVLERQRGGGEEPAEGYYFETHQTKSSAAEWLNEAMRDLQSTITAPVEYFENAFRYAGGSAASARGGEVSAVDHDGARYCLDCARENDAIDVEQYITDPESVRAGGPVFIETETDHEYHCDTCGREIETRVIY